VERPLTETMDAETCCELVKAWVDDLVLVAGMRLGQEEFIIPLAVRLSISALTLLRPRDLFNLTSGFCGACTGLVLSGMKRA